MAGPIRRTRSVRRPAVANLELIDELDLVANAGKVGEWFRRRLADALSDHRHVGEVAPAMACSRRFEFVEDKDDRRFFDPSQKVGARIGGGRLRSAASSAAPCRRATFWALRRRSASPIVKPSIVVEATATGGRGGLSALAGLAALGRHP